MKTKWMASLIIPVLLLCPNARAGDVNVDRAQKLFDEAKSYFDDESYTVACPKFEESKRLAPGLGVTLYLAACEDAIGRRASALSYYREAEAIARTRGDSREQIAHQAVMDLDEKTARIRVHLPKGSPQATVTDNGRPVIVDSRGFPADPGWHKIAVTDTGKKEWHESVHVADSSDDASPPLVDVAVPPLDREPPQTSTPLKTEPIAAADSSATRGSAQRAAGIGIGAAGIVGIGLASYFGLHAMSLHSESNDPGGGCNASDQCNSRGQTLRSSALESATLSTALFAVGGAAIAAGVVLYVAAPSPHADIGVALAPTSVAFRGSF